MIFEEAKRYLATQKDEDIRYHYIHASEPGGSSVHPKRNGRGADQADTSAPTNRIAAAPDGRLSRWDVVDTVTLSETGEIVIKHKGK
jgi:hypothetical protein